jgi:hypothetical protein
VLGDQLDVLGLGSVTAATASSGAVNLFELSLDLAADLDALQAGAFTLATLSLLGVGVGITPIGLTINELGDAAGTLLDVEAIGGTARVVGDGRVAEPSALGLVALGVVAALTFLRPRSRWPGAPRLAGKPRPEPRRSRARAR